MGQRVGFKAHFGAELQRLREASGLTRRQLSEHVPYKAESIKSFETGHRTPTVALAAQCDKFFGTQGMFAALQEQAERDTTPFGELRENEQRATVIRIWDLRMVPGLFQTEEYATAILKEPERVGRRMERQGIFTRDHPPRLWVIISESILYQEIGGPVVLRRQLEHLIREDAPWTLQVMPQSVGWHDGMDGPLTLLEFADESPIGFVDGARGGSVVDDEDGVAELQLRWEYLTANALSPDLSREMIEAVIAELPED